MADDDPFADDKTVLRPGGRRPGARGGSAVPAAPMAPDGGDRTQLRPPSAGHRSSAETPSAPPAPRRPALDRENERAAAPAAVRGSKLNPLVDAATTLLVLVGQLRNTARHPDVVALRGHVVQELRSFDSKVREAGIASETALSARYAMCTVLDETVLSTPWGSESPWARQTLLSAFHKLTGTPILLNTSFNVQEPIVCSPEHAIHCFMSNNIDILVMDDYIISKQPR